MSEVPVTVEKDPITVGYWSCERCFAGGVAPSLERAESAAVAHAALHAARQRAALPVLVDSWIVRARVPA